jgi:hypothetical protein
MRNYTRVAALFLGASLITAACGSDTNETLSTTTTMSTATTMSTEEMEMDHEHSDDASLIEWEGQVPELEVTAVGEGSEVALHIDLKGFRLSRPGGSDGDGHLHVEIDGEAAGMFFEEEIHLEGVAPGTHHIEVALNTNDHGTYSRDGSPLSSSLMVTVADDGSAEVETEHETTRFDADVAEADQVVEVHIVDGRPEGGSNRVSIELGTTVAVHITSDTADEVHVHGYDIVRALSADSTIEFAFTASIPGVFEVELEDSGRLVMELEIS